MPIFAATPQGLAWCISFGNFSQTIAASPFASIASSSPRCSINPSSVLNVKRSLPPRRTFKPTRSSSTLGGSSLSDCLNFSVTEFGSFGLSGFFCSSLSFASWMERWSTSESTTSVAPTRRTSRSFGSPSNRLPSVGLTRTRSATSETPRSGSETSRSRTSSAPDQSTSSEVHLASCWRPSRALLSLLSSPRAASVGNANASAAHNSSKLDRIIRMYRTRRLIASLSLTPRTQTPAGHLWPLSFLLW